MIESAEEFVRLRTSEDPADYHRAAHEEAPLAVWEAVIEGWPEMREWVAHNKTVPIEILERLADDVDPKVRFVVATKRKLSEELFAKLAEDPDEGVRSRIAYNAKVPLEVAQRLTRDPSTIVSDAASRHLSDTGYGYVDGNNNTYVIGRRLEYIPVTEEQSSSGSYSGGAPKTVYLTDMQLANLVELLDQIAADQANVLVDRLMGSGTVVREGVRTYCRASSELKDELEQALAAVLTPSRG